MTRRLQEKEDKEGSGTGLEMNDKEFAGREGLFRE
jgi:hypothetical protein